MFILLQILNVQAGWLVNYFLENRLFVVYSNLKPITSQIQVLHQLFVNYKNMWSVNTQVFHPWTIYFKC